jgi:hypothetical protein
MKNKYQNVMVVGDGQDYFSNLGEKETIWAKRINSILLGVSANEPHWFKRAITSGYFKSAYDVYRKKMVEATPPGRSY